LIGRKLGHYEVTAPLGRGGMGEVYRARDTRLGREVALKVLPADSADDPARRSRFEREARLVASLNHPNVVGIHAVEEIDGVRFLAMELVEGRTLAHEIPAEGLPLERFFEIAIPLADALASAHARGITHRDLKPSNVMLDAEGRVKVLDFGLAKLVAAPDRSDQETVADAQVTAEGRILGTAAYMSPEQAEGKELDARSDIFSLGVVLYEMACGRRPFVGDTPISTVSAILRESPPSVTQLRSGLPRHLGRVIGRCLEKKPDKRFQTSRDVCNELEGLREEIRSGEHDAPTAAARTATATPARRRWLPVALAASGLAAAVLAGWAVFHERSPAPERVLTSRPLTSLLGWELGGSWSPDGSFVAYTDSAEGATNIAIVSARGGDPIRLVAGEADDVSPRWSPDNRWIAFASNRDGETAIYLVPPLGGTLRPLVRVGVPPLSDLIFGALGATPWSPDGAALVFSRLAPDGATMAVWSIEIDTGVERQLTRPAPGELHTGGSLSTAGDRLAYATWSEGGTSLVVASAEGAEPRVVVSEPTPYTFASWGPGDESLVYSTESGGLWLVELASGRRRQLSSASSHVVPIVSRSGRILYSTMSHQTDLYLLELDSGAERRLTAHTLDNFGASIAPDNRSVAYGSTRTGNGEIWILDLESGKERQLSDRPGLDGSPDWAPDGRTIAYISNHDGRSELWAVDAAGGGPRRVTDREAYGPVRFTPDGTGIGFLAPTASGTALFVADRSTGAVSELLAGLDGYGWYRDRRHVVYTPSATEASGELRVIDLDTGREVLLHDEPHVELDVAPDGSALSYCSAQSHSNMNLFVLPLTPPGADGLPRAAGPPEQVTRGEGLWHVHNGGFAPDGRSVVFTRDTDTGDVHVLDGAF
jgi:Tol biopolymer transport system component